MPDQPAFARRRQPTHATRLAVKEPAARPLTLGERLAAAHLNPAAVAQLSGSGSQEDTASLGASISGGLIRALYADGLDDFYIDSQGGRVRLFALDDHFESAHVDVRLDLKAGAVYVFDCDVTSTRNETLYPSSYSVAVHTSGSSDAPLLMRTEALTAPAGHLVFSYTGTQDRDYALVRIWAVGPTATYWDFRSVVVRRGAV